MERNFQEVVGMRFPLLLAKCNGFVADLLSRVFKI